MELTPPGSLALVESEPGSSEQLPVSGVLARHLLSLSILAPRAGHLGSIPAFGVDPFVGRVTPVNSKLVLLQWLPGQAPGVLRSELGLAGPMSEYCDWVRLKV